MVNVLIISAFSLHFLLIGAFDSLSTHQSCAIDENRNGLCRDIKDCNMEIFLKQGITPKYCDVARGRNVKVCCPIENYCGIKGSDNQERIGIRVAAVNEWPWMALLGIRKISDVNDMDMVCNGVLINNQYVLTTAACVFHKRPSLVRLGEHNLISVNEGANPMDVPIVKKLYHPRYRTNRRDYSLALVKLAYKIQIKADISPICLPWGTSSSTDMIGKQLTTTGWLLDISNKIFLPQLTEVETEMFHSAVCGHIYSSVPQLKNIFTNGVTLDKICAGHEERAEQNCQSGYGSPLMYQDVETGEWTLGAIHIGLGCGTKEKPGIYTSVRNLETLSWITRTAFA